MYNYNESKKIMDETTKECKNIITHAEAILKNLNPDNKDDNDSDNKRNTAIVSKQEK